MAKVDGQGLPDSIGWGNGMNEQTFWICRVNIQGQGMQDLVTLLPPESASARGLAPEGIVGQLLKPLDQGGTVSPENFAQNRVFVDFLHEVIAQYRGGGGAPWGWMGVRD